MAPKTAAKPAAKAAQPAAKAAAKGGAAPQKAQPKAAAPATQKKSGGSGDGSAIYIRGLNPKVRAADVYEFFGTFGAIKEVRVRSGKYTLVWFKDQSAAKKAQSDVNGKNVKGTKVSVEAGRAVSRPNKADVATSVWLGKLPGGATKKQLIELVKGFGKIHKIRLSEKKHQAFIYFEDNAVAKKAVAGLAGKELRGAKVEAQLSIRSVATDKKKFGKTHIKAKPTKVATSAAKPAAKTAAKEAAKPAAKAAVPVAAPAKETAKPAAKPAAQEAAKPATKAAASAAKPAQKAAPKTAANKK